MAAFVIDDVAYETASMDRFASLGVPLTFAILPREKHSGELARKAGRLHFPVMLHLPMEPKDRAHNDPGPSGLYLSMTDSELQSQFEKNIDSVPTAVGINNHMGSAFTESRPKMDLVMGWAKKRNLYFLVNRYICVQTLVIVEYMRTLLTYNFFMPDESSTEPLTLLSVKNFLINQDLDAKRTLQGIEVFLK